YDGRVVAELPRDAADAATIGLAMAGGTPGVPAQRTGDDADQHAADAASAPHADTASDTASGTASDGASDTAERAPDPDSPATSAPTEGEADHV
ncbi:MAG TPA: hypothetical protein VGF17_25420, partial [Phytomonospora sp.]